MSLPSRFIKYQRVNAKRKEYPPTRLPSFSATKDMDGWIEGFEICYTKKTNPKQTKEWN